MWTVGGVVLVACASGSAHAGYIEVLDGTIRPPEGDDFIDVSFGMALREEGTVFCWYSPPPPGNNFVALGEGGSHALDVDGYAWVWSAFHSAWGHRPEPYREIDTSGEKFTIALKTDGTIEAWGSSEFDQLDEVPTTNDFAHIAAAGHASVGLREDGSLLPWGTRAHGMRDVPQGNDFVAVSGGGHDGLALRADGSLAAWGEASFGGGVPPGNDYVRIAAGGHWNWAIREDGSLARWSPGARAFSEVRIPPVGYRYLDVATLGGTSVAVVGRIPEPGTCVLLLSALVATVTSRWRRRAAAGGPAGFPR
jgi:hypothetical protein